MTILSPITVNRHSSREERQYALTQIYRQVLERQPYSHECQQLAQLEKDFLSDKIGVRRFLKELGYSEVYLNAFYYSYSNLKFLELCFKHFMGRAPLNHDEIKHYCDVLMHGGVVKLITALLDSEEYRKAFGCFTVPYPRQQACYESPKAFLESKILNSEHIGQRGRALPTIYWHQLNLNCNGGFCHPEVGEVLHPQLSTTKEDLLQEELLDMLKALDAITPKETAASLAPERKVLI